jgi:hypothetical protein
VNSSILRKVGLSIVLVAGVPLWSQVNNAPDTGAVPASGTLAAPTTDTTAAQAQADDRMQTPPPVSGAAYPSTYAAQERSNYLRGGLTFTTAYNDNVLGGLTSNRVSDISYSIFPNIALDETTPRLHLVLSYSPGFTFYQRVSARNQENQNVSVDFKYRLSPHVTLSLRDTFQKSSSVLDQPDLASPGAVTGGLQGVGIALISPLADQLNNNGSPELTYQFSANGMIGASGTFTNLHYSNPDQVPGLFDSSSQGGSAFYSHRLSKKHYLGASYQYQRIVATPIGAQSQTETQTETQTHAVLAFYTFYPQPKLSLSVSAGPQHYDLDQGQLSAQSWSPAATASVGWQARHTNLAASYSRMVSGGGGLLGAFHSNTANLSLRQQLSKNWSASASGAYVINKQVTELFFLPNPGGHSISGGASVQRLLGQRFSATANYTRLHQSYSEVAAISTAPDTNVESVSISYQFARPLGR